MFPFLGICFGFQLAIVEFARNVCKLTECKFNRNQFRDQKPCSIIYARTKTNQSNGRNDEIGPHNIQIESGSIASKIYRKNMFKKRHRHRYEFNQKYRDLE